MGQSEYERKTGRSGEDDSKTRSVQTTWKNEFGISYAGEHYDIPFGTSVESEPVNYATTLTVTEGKPNDTAVAPNEVVTIYCSSDGNVMFLRPQV
jgi:hypothetical protein